MSKYLGEGVRTAAEYIYHKTTVEREARAAKQSIFAKRALTKLWETKGIYSVTVPVLLVQEIQTELRELGFKVTLSPQKKETYIALDVKESEDDDQ